MGRPRVLVSGGSGFLGGYLLQRLARGYEVYAGFRSGAPRGRVSPVRLELTDKASIDAVRRLAPGYVVHNAALTKPDLCEDDPNSARAVNVDGTRLLAEAVQDSCTRFVYCSTDLVFDGAAPNRPRPIRRHRSWSTGGRSSKVRRKRETFWASE